MPLGPSEGVKQSGSDGSQQVWKAGRYQGSGGYEAMDWREREEQHVRTDHSWNKAPERVSQHELIQRLTAEYNRQNLALLQVSFMSC